jgi:hypothetical protein
MEYQSLIRVILSSDPILDGFEKIRGYQKQLMQIGAPWDADGVLSYGRDLIIDSLENEDTTSAIKTVTLVWDLYNEELMLPWHLLREYFRQTDILAHPYLKDLVRFTLHEKWLNALWALTQIGRESDGPNWWSRIMPVLRQRALDLLTPPPLQVSQSILSWYQNEKHEQEQIIDQLSGIVKNWRYKGADLAESPFEYEIMGLFQNELELPRNLRSEFRQSFAAGQSAIRELIKVWETPNLEALDTAIRKVAGWDPDRWGSIPLEKQTLLFQTWLENLYAGPNAGTEPISFLEQMSAGRPELELLLGTPVWVRRLIASLNAIHSESFLANYQVEILEWFPWLLRTRHPEAIAHDTPEMSIEEVLTHFQQHLKSWSDIEAGLSNVRKHAPIYHPECKTLAGAFQNALMLNASHQIRSITPIQSPHPSLDESYHALGALSEWRQYLENNEPEKAMASLRSHSISDWRLIEHAHRFTTNWQQEIQPYLIWMNSVDVAKNQPEENKPGSPLSNTAASYAAIFRIWGSILDNGVHQPILEELTSEIDRTRQSFLKWRQDQEQSSDHVVRLTYHAYLDQIRRISNKLLQLSTLSRQANLSMSVFMQDGQTNMPIKLNTLDNIMTDLSAIESILVSEKVDRQFPKWAEDFYTLLTETTPEGRRQVVLSLSAKHPIYSLIVQSVFSN